MEWRRTRAEPHTDAPREAVHGQKHTHASAASPATYVQWSRPSARSALCDYGSYPSLRAWDVWQGPTASISPIRPYPSYPFFSSFRGASPRKPGLHMSALHAASPLHNLLPSALRDQRVRGKTWHDNDLPVPRGGRPAECASESARNAHRRLQSRLKEVKQSRAGKKFAPALPLHPCSHR